MKPGDTGHDPSAGRIGSWFQTFTEKRFWLLDPRAEEVDPVDIAHHLSLQCRFNGACKKFYSVAEHCVRVSIAIEDYCRSTADEKLKGIDEAAIQKEIRDQAFWGLMHDASEAYVGDMVRPLKVHDEFFQKTEAGVVRAICERFSMSLEEPEVVKHYDMVLLATEKRDICTGNLLWSLPPNISPLAGEIAPWDPSLAEQVWMRRFCLLGGSLWPK